MGERVCPDCGHAGTDRFCGRCGALLPDVPAAGGVDPPAAVGPARTRVVAVVLGVLGLLVLGAVLVRTGGAPAGDELVGEASSDEGELDDDRVAIGRPLGGAGPASATPLPRPSPVPLQWERPRVVEVRPDDRVVAAGDEHVLAGGRAIATGAGIPTALRALPAAVGVVDRDGGWALADGRVLTRGTLGDGSAGTAATEQPLEGGAVAWRNGEPVLRSQDGRLVRVRRDGSAAWRTAVAVTPTGPHGDAWVVGTDEEGAVVAVGLDDGAVQELPARVLAVVGDVAVLAGEEERGHDLRTGEERWRRASDGASWEVLGDMLVAMGGDRAVRVDPSTGTATGTVTGFTPVPTRHGAVVQRNGVLQALRWDGTDHWRAPLELGASHTLATVDGDRLAVRSSRADGVVVTVLDAADGSSLARVPAPPRTPPAPELRADAVGVRGTEDDAPTWLQLADGSVVPEPAGATPPTSRVASEAGPLELEVGHARVTASFVDGRGEAWSARPGVPLAAPPAAGVARLLVPLVDGRVLALDQARGTVQWEVDLGRLPTALAAVGDTVVVATADGHLVTIDDTGTLRGRIDLGSTAVGPRPTVVGLAATADGVVVLDARGDVRAVALP